MIASRNTIVFMLIIVVGIIYTGCKKIRNPVITTLNPVSVTINSAAIETTVSTDGGPDISERGVCWSIHPTPTVISNKKACGSGSGNFSCTVTNLESNTTYYLKSYAINENGVYYGNEVQFTTYDASDLVMVTMNISFITSHYANAYVNINYTNEPSPTQFGIKWSNSPAMTSCDSIIRNFQIPNNSHFKIEGLQPGTQYYMQAFAINDAGTSTSTAIDVTTVSANQAPEIQTHEAYDIMQYGASFPAEIISHGSDTITEYGVYVSTSNQFDDATGNTFKLIMQNSNTYFLTNTLLPETHYYYRAYAINAVGTAYGATKNLTTPDDDQIHFSDGVQYGTVTDIDGNSYRTIQIGNQKWFAENLRTSRYRNGELIPEISEFSDWTNSTQGAWCHYDNESRNEIPYGKLYNWYAVSSNDGLCPAGWHVASHTEWLELPENMETTAGFAGHFMREQGIHWIQNTACSSNSSGFTALPGGCRTSKDNFDGQRDYAYFWSSTQYNASNAIFWQLYGNSDQFSADNIGKSSGLSVRCIKD
ncbi:MAG: hypothetical protein KBB11_11840 [Bacteroidales bacterium]|nr:hypothetical protein [Bacteroidales bacterium]HOY38596.1 FISUMP domain-containing protein [Bacteroidales bacterium]HQP04495.1 FISUMP domain-containing protein [Bacteroidales bacterium]